MRSILAVLVILAAITPAACTRRVPADNFVIIIETPTYRIGQTKDLTYMVWAVNPTEARRAIDLELSCGKRPCAIEPGGVVTWVDTYESTK